MSLLSKPDKTSLHKTEMDITSLDKTSPDIYNIVTFLDSGQCQLRVSGWGEVRDVMLVCSWPIVGGVAGYFLRHLASLKRTN
jgi:hypothetical protein